MKRPVVSFDGFGTADWGDVEWRFRVFTTNGFPSEMQMLGAEPRRKVLAVEAYTAGNGFSLNPFPAGADAGRYLVGGLLAFDGKTVFHPYRWGPIVSGPWWIYSGNGTDPRVTIAEALVG